MTMGHVLGVSLGVGAILVASVWAGDKGHTTDALDQVKAKVEAKKAILVDVRERPEWDRGHIRGAVLIPLSKLRGWEKDGMTDAEKARLLEDLPKGSVVYCHCASGNRCLSGGEALRKLGYDARPLKPGYSALVKAGFPRETKKK